MPGNQRAATDVYIAEMDLTYPAETEPFRKEVRAWLEENLPEGWFDPDFDDERRGATSLQRHAGPRSSSPVAGSARAGPSSTAARA